MSYYTFRLIFFPIWKARFQVSSMFYLIKYSSFLVSTLLRFFSARLADSVLLTSSCLKSLYFLVPYISCKRPRVCFLFIFRAFFQSQCSNFPNGGEQAVLTSLFKEHMVQALVQQDRFLVFSLIKHYLATRIEG